MRRTTLMACEFGYGGASFQLAIEDAQLQKLAHPRNSGFQPDDSCRLPACVVDRQDAPVAQTGKMPVVHLRHPEEAESVGALNSHMQKLPNKFLACARWP